MYSTEYNRWTQTGNSNYCFIGNKVRWLIVHSWLSHAGVFIKVTSKYVEPGAKTFHTLFSKLNILPTMRSMTYLQ